VAPVVNKFIQLVLFPNVLWHGARDDTNVLWHREAGCSIKALISMQDARALAVEMMLVRRPLTVTKSAALVDLSPGKSMRLPSTVHLTLYWSAVVLSNQRQSAIGRLCVGGRSCLSTQVNVSVPFLSGLLWALASFEASPHFLLHCDFPTWSVVYLAEFFVYCRGPMSVLIAVPLKLS
jgi:hypothetical protein